MQLKKILTLIVLISTFISSFAQANNAFVSGAIRDEQSKEPLPYVNVILAGNDGSFILGTITNEKGLFTLEGLSTGDYSVKVSYIGYSEKIIPDRKSVV